MDLDQKDRAGCPHGHGCKQDVDFKITRGDQAGRRRHQEPQAENQERAPRASATDKESSAAANGYYEEESEPGLRRLKRRFTATHVYDKRCLQRIDQAGTPDGTRCGTGQEG